MLKILSENVYDRQQTVQQLHLCPYYLTEHPKGQCNSKYRCQVDNCNGFHHSTIHRNNFNTTQPSNQEQNQSISEYRHNGYSLNRNQFNFTNNSSSWNKNLSCSNPNKLDKMVTVVTTGNAAEADTTAATTTTTTTTASSTATATIAQIVTTTIVTATTDITGTSITGNHIKCPIRPMFNNSSQHQETLINNISTQQTKIRKCFSGSNNRHQNYTCSNNQPSSWIRPHVQLQAIPVTVFSETVSIETYALLDSGSDNTQITKTIADALGIRDRKCVTIPVPSLYQEHTIETTEIFLRIGAIDSSRLIINLPVFATSTTDFQMPTVPIQMLNSVCKDFGHLGDIKFPQIRDNKIGILIGADAFTATVPLKYTIGPPGTPY